MISIAFWMGIFWRRTTEIGAWAATLVGSSGMVALDTVIFHFLPVKLACE